MRYPTWDENKSEYSNLSAYIDAMLNAGMLTVAEATDAYKRACKGEYLIKPAYDDMQLVPYAELEQP